MRGATASASQEPPPGIPSPDLPGRAARIYDDCETTVAKGREVYNEASAVLLSLRRMLRRDACPAIESQITQLITAVNGFRSSVNDLNGCGWEVQQHLAEHRMQMEKALAEISLASAIFRAGVQAGLEQAAQQQASRPRSHARPRRSYLRPVVAAAGVAAVTVTGGASIAAQNDASQHPMSASTLRPAILRAADIPADTATLVPSSSPSRPHRGAGTAAKTAAPVVTLAPPVTVSSAPPPQQPSAPPAAVPPSALQVSVSDLSLTGTTGTFTLAATGDAVDWTASTDIPGATLSVVQGVLSSAQQPVTVELTDPLGEMGTIFIQWDNGGVTTVRVWPATSSPADPSAS